MADTTPTTRRGRAEDTAFVPQTPLSKGFSALMREVAVFIVLDNELDTFDCFDLAYSGWQRRTELAQERVTTRLRRLLSTAPQRPADKRLRLVLLGLHRLISAEEPNAFCEMHALLSRTETLFRCPGSGTHERRVDRLLRIAQRQVSALAALPCYLPCAEHDEESEIDALVPAL